MHIKKQNKMLDVLPPAVTYAMKTFKESYLWVCCADISLGFGARASLWWLSHLYDEILLLDPRRDKTSASTLQLVLLLVSIFISSEDPSNFAKSKLDAFIAWKEPSVTIWPYKGIQIKW